MNNQILKLLKNTWGLLIFALLAGGAYFVIVLRFVLSHTNNGSGLLAYFFAPAVICGAALVLIKTIKQSVSEERNSAALTIFWLHVLLMAMSVVFLITMF